MLTTGKAIVDQTYTAVMDSEKVIAEWTERMLIGVAGKYGKNRESIRWQGNAAQRSQASET